MKTISFRNIVRKDKSQPKIRVIDFKTSKPKLDDNGDYIMKYPDNFLKDDKGNLLTDDQGRKIPDYSSWIQFTFECDENQEIPDLMPMKQVKMYADQFKAQMGKDMTWDECNYHLGSPKAKPFKHLDEEGNESWRIILRYGPPKPVRPVSGIPFGK